MIDDKIKEQGARIQHATDVFKEALLTSNRTYFLEEMCKQKAMSKTLKKDIKVYIDKNKNDVKELRMAKDTICVRESTINGLEQNIS